MGQSTHAHAIDSQDAIALLQATIFGGWCVAQDFVNLKKED